MFNCLTNIMSQKIIIIALCFITIGFCQEKAYKVEIFSNPIDTDYWWLTKNNNGKYINNNIVDFKWKINNPFTNYQITLSNGFSKDQEILLGESFIKHNFSQKISFKAGKYYRDFSLYLNDNLSSGSMLVSNNAQPLPKIGLTGSFSIKKMGDISFDWGVAHGWFKKNQYYTNPPLLHEKFIYLNIIRQDIHQLSIGFVHEAMWAGTTIDTGYNNNPGKQPDSFKDFLKVFISADGPLREGEPHANALGSHIGIWDFIYTKKNDGRTLKLYYQHYFEDTSSLRFQNKTDGLWGIELTNYIPKINLLIEYLDTSHCCINPPYQRDIYYWNYQYNDGWKYKDMIIGNPFVNSSEFIELTRLFHFGMSGSLGLNTFQVKASRKTNISDDIKFRASIERNIYDNINLTVFLVGDNNENGFGFVLSYLIKD